MGVRDIGRRAIDWLTVADARRALPAATTARFVPASQIVGPPRGRRMMLFDGEYRPVDQVISEMWRGQGRATSEEALAVPGVLRARNLICGIASWPLADLGRDNVRRRNPLLEQIDPNVTNIVTRAALVQDLLFEGVGWMRVLDTDRAGFPLHMEHLAWHRVTVQPIRYADGMSPLPSGLTPREAGSNAQIFVDGEHVTDLRTIKRFDSPNPGVLKAAGDTIKLAATYRRTSIMYADNPRMDGYLYPKEGADPVQDEGVGELLDDWEAARQAHTTGYVPAALGYQQVDALSPADLQLKELQEQATREVALALGLEPADLGVSSVTETYSNRVDKRIDRINDLLAAYVAAFDERMSMNDITPHGRRVYSDPNAFLRANPTERIAYYQGMQALGAMDSHDVSDAENLPRKALPSPAQSPPGGSGGNVVPLRGPSAGAAPQETSRLAATGSATAAFSDDDTRVHTDVVFAAEPDRARREIAGLALPYGTQHVARKNGKKVRFQQGSIVWPAPRYVPVLIDHVNSSSVGHYLAVDDNPDGTYVVAKISAGPRGDQVLFESTEEASVRTGFSVGVEYDDADLVPDPGNPGVWLVPVGAAIGKEISLVAVPAFQGARVASVTLSADEGVAVPAPSDTQQQPGTGPDTTTTQPQQPGQPAPQPAPSGPPAPQGTFSAEQLGQVFAAYMAQQPAVDMSGAGPQFVDPTRGRPAAAQAAPATAATQTFEAAPYRFDYEGNLTPGPQYDFSADLVAAMRDRDGEAYKRALKFMQEMTVGSAYGHRPRRFEVDRADVAGLNPTRQRPDLYVPQRSYDYPLTTATRRGTLADVTAFTLPKFNTAAGLVAAHTEGVEPTPGSFTVTTQTITPTAKSGALDMTREAWDQGGNPQASALIWEQFNRSWFEGLESGVATFLNTLTAATDIAIAAAAADGALAKAWRGAIARLQFARGGGARFDMMATEQELFVKFAEAETTAGEPIFPMLNPSNRDGQSRSRYTSIDAAGVTAVPSWALASTAGASNNSWLFDSQVVHTWDTGPQRLEFPGINPAGDYSPVAFVRLAVWGYQALANTDITGVRQVTYDTVA